MTAPEDDLRAETLAPAIDFSDYDLASYEGFCLELVSDILNAHPDGDVLYVENLPRRHRWRYHAVVVFDGLVYDAWHPDVRLPPAEYVKHVFGPRATWEINPGSEDDDVAAE